MGDFRELLIPCLRLRLNHHSVPCGNRQGTITDPSRVYPILIFPTCSRTTLGSGLTGEWTDDQRRRLRQEEIIGVIPATVASVQGPRIHVGIVFATNVTIIAR